MEWQNGKLFDFVSLVETCIQLLALIQSEIQPDAIKQPINTWRNGCDDLSRECKGEKKGHSKRRRRPKWGRITTGQHDSKTLPNPRLFCFCRAPKARPEPALPYLTCTAMPCMKKMPKLCIPCRDVVTKCHKHLSISRPLVKSFRCRYHRYQLWAAMMHSEMSVIELWSFRKQLFVGTETGLGAL